MTALNWWRTLRFTLFAGLLSTLLAAPMPSAAQRGGSTAFTQIGQLPFSQPTSDLLMIDVDEDGDDEVVAALLSDTDPQTGEVRDGFVYVYEPNPNASSVSNRTLWTSNRNAYTSLASGDLDRDGDLDLIAGFKDGVFMFINRWREEGRVRFDPVAILIGDPISKVAIVDLDLDQRPDILIGYDVTASAAAQSAATIYFNDIDGSQYRFRSTPLGAAGSGVVDFAWGDVRQQDGSTAPEVLIAYSGNGGIALFDNLVLSGTRTLQFVEILPTSVSMQVTALAVGDLSQNGLPDLAVANQGTNAIFQNLNGDLRAVSDVFVTSETSVDVAIGDVTTDGIPDLVFANQFTSSQIYENRSSNGLIALEPNFSLPSANNAALTLGDIDNDNDLDIAFGERLIAGKIYLNNLSEQAVTSVTLDTQPVANALVLRRTSTEARFSLMTDQQGELLRSGEDGVLKLELAPEAGDEFIALVPTSSDRTYSQTEILAIGSAPVVITSTIAVSEALLVRDLTVEVAGQHNYMSDLRFTLIAPDGRRVVLANQICGSASGFRLIFSDLANSAIGCPPTLSTPVRPQTALGQLRGAATQGEWQLQIEDFRPGGSGQLSEWRLTINSTPYRQYYTNAVPTSSGLQGAVATGAGDLQMSAATERSLLVFDLSVSLEWDASRDQAYLNQLAADLQRTSELLFDWSDGQVILGTITVFFARENWQSADVQIAASNQVRPSALKGGRVLGEQPDPDRATLAYRPGQVTIGATWNRYGNAVGVVGEDWPRALAHELGHYLLFLDDNYIGFDDDGFLTTVEGCPGAMNNPYVDEESEFTPDADWLPNCEQTLSNSETGRSDWATISTLLPGLNAPERFAANTGPSFQPLNLTSVRFATRGFFSNNLTQPAFYLFDSNGVRATSSSSARAVLFKANQVIDLGSPVGNEILARGARIGDRLCLFDLSAQRSGCLNLTATNSQIQLTDHPDWDPEIRLQPLDPNTTAITVSGRLDKVVPSADLSLYRGDSGAQLTTTLRLVPELGVYAGQITAGESLDSALVHLVVETPEGRREAVVDYAQFGGTEVATLTASLSGPVGCPPGRPCTSNAPVFSADGRAFLYTPVPELAIQGVYGLQGTDEIGSAPAWAVPVGKAYRLTAAPGSPPLELVSINIGYSEEQVPSGTEGGLAVYFRAEDSRQWQRLITRRADPLRNEVAAEIREPGIYVLMSELNVGGGWNLINYPWSGNTPIAQGLTQINAQGVEVIYGYREGRWQIYASNVPTYVNSLEQFSYGVGYWMRINASGRTGAQVNSVLSSLVPQPPAVFYYEFPASTSPPQRAEAQIGGQVCASSPIQATPEGRRYIVLIVPADEGGATSGCGAPRRGVNVLVDGELLARRDWQNTGPISLDAARLYLPLIR